MTDEHETAICPHCGDEFRLVSAATPCPTCGKKIHRVRLQATVKIRPDMEVRGILQGRGEVRSSRRYRRATSCSGKRADGTYGNA